MSRHLPLCLVIFFFRPLVLGLLGSILFGMATTAVSRRSLLLTAVPLLLSTGCWGGFNLSRALYKWNDGVSTNKWVKWLVFLAFVVIPVYEVCAGFLDPFIFNTIEFFSGKNPISVGRRDLGGGHEVAYELVTAEPRTVRVSHFTKGQLVKTYYLRKVSEDELELLDESMQVVSNVHKNADGSLLVRDRNGQPISVDADDVRRMSQRLEDGASPSQGVLALLGAHRSRFEIAAHPNVGAL